MSALRRLGSLVLDVLTLALIAVAVVMLSGRVSVQPVLSGSMTGYAGRGDLVIGVGGDSRGLAVGDVILFEPPAPYGTPGGHPVMHRVHTLVLRDGRPVATTKGDANLEADPWTLDLAGTRTVRVRFVLPEAGWPFLHLEVLTTPLGRMLIGGAMMATALGFLLLERRRARIRDHEHPGAPSPAVARARVPAQRQPSSRASASTRLRPVERNRS